MKGSGVFLAAVNFHTRSKMFHRRKNNSRPRCGFTLIEMVAAGTMLVFVLSAVAMTISSLHRLNSKLRDDYPASAALVSLELRLRTDVHAAKQATVETGEKVPPILRLVLADDQTIEYSAKESRVYRYVKTGDKVVRPEIFAIPRGCEVGWSISDSESSLVTATIQWHAGKLPGANDDLRVAKIISVIGWDHAKR
jgi:type II secretory pathway component PulJ